MQKGQERFMQKEIEKEKKYYRLRNGNKNKCTQQMWKKKESNGTKNERKK